MRLRNWIVGGMLLVGVFGAGLVLAREPDSKNAVTSQQLFVEPLAGDASKEVIAQTYTFAALAYSSRRTGIRLCDRRRFHLRAR